MNLIKGQRLEFGKDVNLSKLEVCLGWEVNPSASTSYDWDLDASAFVLGAGPLRDADVVFYNMDRIDASGNVVDRNKYVNDPEGYKKAGMLMHKSGAVIHTGDDRTGAGDITHSKDKEIIKVDLTKLPKDKNKIAFIVTIYDAKIRGQNFGQVNDAFIRVVDTSNNKEVLKFNLQEKFSTATAIVVSEIYLMDGTWKFAAKGEGYTEGLDEIAKKYGYVPS